MDLSDRWRCKSKVDFANTDSAIYLKTKLAVIYLEYNIHVKGDIFNRYLLHIQLQNKPKNLQKIKKPGTFSLKYYVS